MAAFDILQIHDQDLELWVNGKSTERDLCANPLNGIFGFEWVATSQEDMGALGGQLDSGPETEARVGTSDESDFVVEAGDVVHAECCGGHERFPEVAVGEVAVTHFDEGKNCSCWSGDEWEQNKKLKKKGKEEQKEEEQEENEEDIECHGVLCLC